MKEWGRKEKKKFYLTTPIYYINAPPHVGHAYTTIIADVLARWHRLAGKKVFFLTGLDENSAKTVEGAKSFGFKDIQKYTDWMAEKWKKTWKALEISNDGFIRTTEERHKKFVESFFIKVYEREDVYKGKYVGLYCDGCEAFVKESELVDGKCPLHKKVPKQIEEENYFFKLSRFRDKILEYVEKNPDFIQPESRRNEVISFLRRGLEDISISRPGLEWGIRLPINKSHFFWVWFDALLNYLSGVEEGYWPADLHLIAKDILRFHCIIFPAMLMSAGYALPKKIFVHGFLTIEGQKISKSLGNVIDPLYLAKEYSADALRYLLIREVPLGQDGDFSEGVLRRRFNDELADIFGNFVHRTLSFIWKNFDGRVPDGKLDKDLERKIREKVRKIEELVEQLKLKEALDEAISIARLGNEYFQSREPWRTIKEEGKAKDCIFNCINLVKILCVLLYPFIPVACSNLAEQINLKIESLEQVRSFDLKKGHPIKKPAILFRKVS
jgi:methionyl-tRNA synthetase